MTVVRSLGLVCSSMSLVGCGLVLDLGASPSVEVVADASAIDSRVRSTDAAFVADVSVADAAVVTDASVAADAASPDSGVPDTGVPDAGPAVLGCANHPSAFACEDFEGAPPSAPWQQSGTGTFTRVQSPNQRGQYFGRFETEPSARATFRQTVAPLRNGDDIYMRAFIRVHADSAAGWNVLLQAESQPYEAKVSLDFTRDAELNAVRSESVFFRSDFPTQRWACIEAHFFLSSTDGLMDVSVDGTFIGQATRQDTGVTPEGLTAVLFGVLPNTDNTATLRVDLDDVVFSRSPIGHCD